MKHEVFILGGQRIDQKSKGMVERLGEMRKGRRERIEKGSREGIEKETKRQFEEKEALRDPPPPPPPFIRISRSDPAMRCSHCFFKSSGYDKLELKHQILFLQAIIKKICHGVKQNAKTCVIGETECNET